MTRLLVHLVLSGTSVAACTSAAGFTDVFGGAGAGGTTIFDASPSASVPGCPGDAPREGSSCLLDQETVCSYGPDTRPRCNESFVCSNGRWTPSRVSGASDHGCAADCPATHEAIEAGLACADDRVTCAYDEGSCGCVGEEPPDAAAAELDAGDLADAGVDASVDAGIEGGVSARPGKWICVRPPPEIGCPSTPREGESCVRPVVCDYGSCALGRALAYSCDDGRWIAVDPEPCDP